MLCIFLSPTPPNPDSNLWRVHDALYDLEPFLDRHPGGRDWIERTRGLDVTEAFEASHVFADRAEAVLKKYHVKDCKGLPRRWVGQVKSIQIQGYSYKHIRLCTSLENKSTVLTRYTDCRGTLWIPDIGQATIDPSLLNISSISHLPTVQW